MRIDAHTPVARAAPATIGAHVDAVDGFVDALAARDPDPDATHDMRVASRRLRATLGLLGDVRLRGLAKQVKGLQDALGAVRDRQVLREWIADLPDDAEATSAALTSVSRALGPARRALTMALRRWRTRTQPALRRALARHAGRGRLGGHRIRRQLERHERRLDRLLAVFLGTPEPQAAHTARIAAKKLRYELEIATPALGRRARRRVRALRPLQDALGHLHDADVRVTWLVALAARSERMSRRFAPLLARARAERDQCLARALAKVRRHRRREAARRDLYY